MPGTIPINFDEVPDSRLFEPGQYNCQITSAESLPTKAGDGMKLVVELAFLDGIYAGRKIKDHIAYVMDVKIKRLGKAAGLSLGVSGLVIDDLISKNVTAVIVQNPDKDNKEKFYSNVDDYLPAA